MNIMQLTQSQLKELFFYDDSTGIFKWNKKICRHVIVGSIAGSVYQDGYVLIKVFGKRYVAHRLAWLYVYGQFPDGELDHINGNRSDNRIANLRVVTRQGNQQNKARQENNTSGQTGVCFHSRSKLWQAQIYVRGKPVYLGQYKNKEDASVAYIDARRKLFETQPVQRVA